MQIKVYNDGALVHDGTLDGFLADNDHDEWLVEQCTNLDEGPVEFNEISGHWRIEKNG